jgi:hypothetical protein
MRNRLPPSDSTENSTEDSAFIMRLPKNSDIPSAFDLMELSPAKSGTCMKEINSIWVYLFPCWFPKWKSRYFILIGNYLFRYKDEHGERPKGVPIPLDSVTVRVKNGDCFEVSTIRKVYTIRTDSAADAISWVQAIKARKAQAIKEAMGHAQVTKEVNTLNRAAFKLFGLRVKQDGYEGSKSVNNPMTTMFAGQ